MAVKLTPQPNPNKNNSQGGGVYDESGYSPELHHDNLGAHDDLGVEPEQREAEIADLENMLNEPSEDEQGVDAGDNNSPEPRSRSEANRASPDELRGKETNPDEPRYGPSALDDTRERLGLGYTGDPDEMSKDTQRRNKWYNSNSKLKKRMAIAGAAGGGGAAIAVLLFFVMLPLKLVTMSKMLESQYMSQAYSAVEKVGINAFSDYVRSSVITALNTGTCKTTVSPKCVVVPKGTGPFGKVYQAWSKNKLENELATKHGLIFGMRNGGPSGRQYYMNLNGKDIDLNAFRTGDMSLLDLPGTQEVSRADIRKVTREAFKDGTLWDRSVKRYVVNRYLKRQLGIRHCLQRCMWVDGSAQKIDDVKATLKEKELAFKSWGLQRFVPEKFQLLPLCFIDPSTCSNSLDPAVPGDENRLTPAQKQVKQLVLQASERFSQSTLSDLAKVAAEAEDGGIGRALSKAAMERIVKQFLGDAAGKTAGVVAEKAIPIAGWVIAIAGVIHALDVLPDIIHHMAYEENTTTALQVASAFETVVSEQMSGNADSAIIGSFSRELTTDAPDSGELASDATDTPLYQAIMNEGSFKPDVSVALLSFFPQASAATSTIPDPGGGYRCNDKTPVPTGELVCVDDKPDQGSEVLDSIKAEIKSIPGLAPVAGLIDTIGSWAGAVIGEPFMAACKITVVCQLALDGISSAMEKVFSKFSKLLERVLSLLTYRNDGGRKFNTWALGDDVKGNLTMRDKVGGIPGTPEQVAEVRSDYLKQEQDSFRTRSLFSRLFSKDTPYSFVSRASLNTPATPDAAFRKATVALLNNPFERMSTSVTSIAAMPHAYAVTSNGAAIAAAFGTPQYIFPQASIPKHPEEYWNANCAQYYDESTGKLDITDWLNNSTNGDPVFGQTNTKENPCMLLETTFVGIGAAHDPTLIPQDTTSIAPATQSASSAAGAYDDPNVPCAPGTTEAGTVQTQYLGNHVTTKPPIIHLCKIGSIANATLNAAVSGQFELMGAAAKAAGHPLTASSSFRLEDSCSGGGTGTNGCAKPNTSYHQLGIAIDFVLSDGSKAGDPSSCSGRQLSNDPNWIWLRDNAAANFGIKQFSQENWHWDTSGDSNRC